MKRKMSSAIIAICLLLGLALMLSSCSSSDAVGIANAEINDLGELILTYTDGSEHNLGVVVGKDGERGEPGADGADGTDGKDGKDGERGTPGKNGADGADGSLVITADDSSISAASAKGMRSAVSIVCKFKATVQQGGWYPGGAQTTTKSYSSAGSGVIYQLDKSEGDAFIVTNYHVVYDASSNTANGISDDISVYLYGSEIEQKAIKASYVGGSLYYDIAVLRVENSEILSASNAIAAELADSDNVSVGKSAIAIGNARGLGISSTSGIISVDSEYITMTAADGKTDVSFCVMRVDAAVNSGNSGGGLYDCEGKLIGIVNAKIVYDGVENIGYAIPVNVASSIADNIIDYCYETELERVQRPMLGVTVNMSDSKAVYDSDTGLFKIEETVYVYEVGENSLADGVLQAGDVLISATAGENTFYFTRRFHVIDMMLDMRVGDVITVNILRDGEAMSVTITVTQESLESY